MKSKQKLSEYRAALAHYKKLCDANNPPIHKPTRLEFGISRPEEIFVAERIEMELCPKK